MANMNLYSRGDKIFVRINMVLIALFTLSTLYPFIYIAAVSFSDGSAASAGNVVYKPIGLTLAAYEYVLANRCSGVRIATPLSTPSAARWSVC